MIVDYLNIRLVHNVYLEGKHELQIDIQVDGKEYHTREIIPDDDFKSNLDYIFELGKRHLIELATKEAEPK